MATVNMDTKYPNRAVYSATIDTTSTDRQGGDIFIPSNATGAMIIYTGVSTASVTIAYTVSTVAEVSAGTATWLTTGTASTGGTSQVVTFAVPPVAVALYVGTAKAGNNGAIAITCPLK